MTGALVVIAILMAVIAYLCWRLSRIHREASILADCIDNMLRQPRAAGRIAKDTEAELRRLDLWSAD